MTASSQSEYAHRIALAESAMHARSIDCLALTAGSDLAYLCGYTVEPMERLTLLILGTYGPPTLIVPELELPRVGVPDGLLELKTWSDDEDMLAIAVSELRRACPPGPIIAVSEGMRAFVLLGFQERYPHARFVPAGRIMGPLRVVKSPAEIAALAAAASAADGIVAGYSTMRWQGRTEADVAREITGMIIDTGHECVNFVIVASGPNGASPHHTAGDRRIEHGDAVVVDIGGTMGGYCSDVTRVVSVGEPVTDVARAYEALRLAQEAAVTSVRPGVTAGSVDACARDLLAEAGHADHFIHRTGHGIGMDEHEEPFIVRGSEAVLQPGMCFTIEPGIYVPGAFGLRIEDVVVVTDDGAERLGCASRDIVVV